jgi:hypothetical protein
MGNDEARQRILDGSAWNDFCERLKAAGTLLSQEGPPDDLYNRAMGYRYLTRMLRAGLESAVDYADPQYPAFFRLADDTKKVLNDNPDNYYENCIVDGRFDYRISGERGTVKWFSLGTKGGTGEVGKMASTGELDSSQMHFEDDGSFEILVSQKQQPGNWLPMSESTGIMVLRQTFGNKAAEEIARMKIECLNPERLNNNLAPQELEGQLVRATGFMSSTVQLCVDWMRMYEATENALPKHDQKFLQAAGGDPTITYYQSRWKLDPGEALVVTLRDIPDCETWNLQLSNYWMESLEHRFFPVVVNKFTAQYESDGGVVIVVADEDPGAAYPNWLHTLGHREGGWLGRFVGCANPPDEMPVRKVQLSDLR